MTTLDDSIIDDADNLIEDGYAMIMRGFYRLRLAGLVQEEYDRMGVIMNMLSQDRDHIRNAYTVRM